MIVIDMVSFIIKLFVCWNLFCTIANLRIKCVTETKNVSVLFYKNRRSRFLYEWGFFTLLVALAHGVACGHWVMISRRWRIASRCRAKKEEEAALFMMLLPHSILNCIYFSESSYCKVPNSIMSCLEDLKSHFLKWK